MAFNVTVTVAAVDYESYVSLADATKYITAIYGPNADAWLALAGSGSFSANDIKGRTLLAATDYLNRQAWQGTPTGLVVPSGGPPAIATGLAWPRLNVVDVNGEPVDSTVVPATAPPSAFTLFAAAVCEFAMLLVADPTIYTAKETGSNVRDLKAGPVEVSYFKPTIGYLNGATKLPAVLMDMLGVYLAASITNAGKATGTYACSQFSDWREYTRSWGF